MADYTEKLTDAKAMDIIDQVGSAFKSLPHLPSGVVDVLVKIAPYFALLGGVVGIIFGPVIGVIGGLASILTLSPLLMISTLANAVIMIVQSILLLLAFSPLKNRQMKGWIFLFWSQVMSIALMVLSLLLGHAGSIVGSILGLAIGMYILFETRDSYNGVISKVAEQVKDAASN